MGEQSVPHRSGPTIDGQACCSCTCRGGDVHHFNAEGFESLQPGKEVGEQLGIPVGRVETQLQMANLRRTPDLSQIAEDFLGSHGASESEIADVKSVERGELQERNQEVGVVCGPSAELPLHSEVLKVGQSRRLDFRNPHENLIDVFHALVEVAWGNVQNLQLCEDESQDQEPVPRDVGPQSS